VLSITDCVQGVTETQKFQAAFITVNPASTWQPQGCEVEKQEEINEKS